MNILNQSPVSGHPAFPAARGPGGHHHHDHPDACQHLLPAALPLPASSSLKSFQPSRSASRTPLVVANGGSPPREEPVFHREDAPNMPFKTKSQSSSAVVGSMEDVCKLSIKDTGSAAGDVEFQPCTALGFLRSLVEGDKFSSLIKGYYTAAAAGGDDLEVLPPEAPGAVTLAVSVASAVKLDRGQMAQIAKKMRRLTGFKNLRLENTVDPSLIAGFVISYVAGDAHVIDLSVKRRLAELEAQLESSDQSTAAGWNFPS